MKNLFQRNALFVEIKGVKEPLMAFANKDDKYQIGDTVKAYLPYDYIDFIEESSGKPLLSKYEIHNELSEEDRKIVESHIKGLNIDEEFPLHGLKIYHRRDKIDKKEYHIFKVKVLDVENHDGHAIIYYRLPGMKGYLSAIVDEDVDMVVNPKLSLMIKR